MIGLPMVSLRFFGNLCLAFLVAKKDKGDVPDQVRTLSQIGNSSYMAYAM